jgi:hypothetical protein
MKQITTRTILPVILAILTLFILTGCSNPSNGPELDPTQGVQLLAGEYTTIITADDVGKFTFSSDPELASNQGTWRMVLTENGEFTAELNGVFIAHGKYSVTGNRIEIYIDQVCDDCDCRGSIDRYHWILDGQELTFSHIAGTCTGLRLVLTAHPLTRTP